MLIALTSCIHIQGGTVHQSTRPGRKLLISIATTAAIVTALAGCTAGTGPGDASSPKEFTFLGVNENTTIPASSSTTLKQGPVRRGEQGVSAEDQQASAGHAGPTASTLGWTECLPVMFSSPNSPALTEKLYEAKHIVNFDSDSASTSPAQSSPRRSRRCRHCTRARPSFCPQELNIEGIWYNKQYPRREQHRRPHHVEGTHRRVHQAQGRRRPADLQAGKGGDGWGVTRWVGEYIARWVRRYDGRRGR